MTETLRIGELTFEVRRSERRRTLGLTVDRGGELVVHAPRDASLPELEKWVGGRLVWVHRKLSRKEELTPRGRGPEYVTGESFYYLGRSYRLTITARQEERLRFDGRRFHLRRDARPGAEDDFRQWYVSTGKEWIRRRVGLLTRKTGYTPVRIDVKDLGFRWGSCSRNRVILFNWKLLQLPVRLADYVIVHELIHLVEPNHGSGFWRALEGAMPDWRERKEALDLRAQEIYWCREAMAQ